VQKYKGKAVIDMFVDRLGKGTSAMALIVVLAMIGIAIRWLLAVALAAIVVWIACAARLGRAHATLMRAAAPTEPQVTPSTSPPVA
jgi:ATP/ADP translocase